jgi:hypothetical protein
MLQQWICVAFGLLAITYLLFEWLPFLARRTLGLNATSLGSDTEEENEDDKQELCDACKYDVRGLKTCPECGRSTPKARRDALARLRNEWPADEIKPRIPDANEKRCVILESRDQMATLLLRQHLLARGIQAHLDETETPTIGPRVPSKIYYQLIVWTNDQEQARAVIDRLWPEALR